MSTAVSTSRANHRPTKDKSSKALPLQTQNVKAEGPPTKMQPTQDQIRMAQMISDPHADDKELEKKIKQVVELTGRSLDAVEIALHDCQNDIERAVNMLLEGEADQGEWRESGKKKKRPVPAVVPKPEPMTNHIDERADGDKRDRSHERENSFPDRQENIPRPRRRDNMRPPRLSRGRGRERGDFWQPDREDGERNINDDNTFGNRERNFDRGRGRGRGGRRGRGRDRPVPADNFRSFDNPQYSGINAATETPVDPFIVNRERPQPADGGFKRNIQRGGHNRFEQNSSQRFDAGPQIDTWTNETAENAEKENANSNWGDSMVTEDWNDDTWTGSVSSEKLTETKVFTASSAVQTPMMESSVPMNDTTCQIGQRLDLSVLLQKTPNDSSSLNDTSYISQYNQQATESIKNSIGIGSSRQQSMTQSLPQPMGQSMNQISHSLSMSPSQKQSLNQSMAQPMNQSLSQMTQSLNQSLSQSLNQPMSQSLTPPMSQSLTQPMSQSLTQTMSQPMNQSLNQTLTQSMSQSFGQTMGQGMGQSLSQAMNQSLSQPMSQALSGQLSSSPSSQTTANVNALVSLSQQSEQHEPVMTSRLTGSQAVTSMPSSQTTHNVMQQRSKPSRTKLPPPSKIPASAVEMPGHMMTTLDVQFGLEFGGDNSPFSFGNVNDAVVSNSYSTQAPNSTSTVMSNHMNQMTQSSEPVISSSIMTSPSTNVQSSIAGSDQTSPRTNVFQNSTYTTPPKKEASPLSQSNKMSPPEPIPFPPSQSERKSSPLMASQRSAQSGSSLTQGSLSSTKADPAASLSSYVPTSASYNSSSYQHHKSPGMTSSPGFSSHPSTSQSGSYQQYQSGSNQYQPSQNQYSSTQNQFQTGHSQYPSSQSQYHSSQNQYQNNQNQYQNYQTGSGTFHQNQSSYPSSQTNQSSLYQNSAPTSSYQSQPTQNSMYQGAASQQTSTYQSQANSGYSSRDSGTSSNYPSTQSSSSYPSAQTGSYQNAQSVSSYQNPAAGASYQNSQTGPYPSSGSQSGSTSYQRDSQSSLSTPSTQSQSTFSSQSYGPSGHQTNLQTSPLSANKLGDSLSKMAVKDSALDSRDQTSSQYETTTSTTTSSLTTSTSTTALASATTTAASPSSSATTTNVAMTRMSTLPTNTKAPPNLPPGVPLLGHQYIMGQGTLPPFYGLQQQLYPSYEEMQLLQQRLPALNLQNNMSNMNAYYDMSSFTVPTTLPGREQVTLGNVAYSGVGTTENKLNRVEAQSPIPTSQQATSQSTHQQPYPLHYAAYYYPSMMPGAAAGFQYPTMFPMPPVTNTAHAGNTPNTQFQKTYGSHAYGSGKGYDDLTQAPDFTKTVYGAGQSQPKATPGMSAVSSVSSDGIPVTGYGKSHSQAFDKQGFHAGTPPPFNLPLATGTQAGPMGAPTTPYGTPFVPMMAHQPHSQMMHMGVPQDSTVGTSRVNPPASTQPKTGGAKSYTTAYWNAS